MPLTQEEFIALAHRHAQAESDADVEGTLATLEAEPAYHFYPAGRKFTGMDNTRRFYEHFVSHFKPRIRNVEFHGEAVGADGLYQEYTVTLEGDDGQARDYRILGVLVFGENALAGERIYADEALFRLLAGPLWNKMEPIPQSLPTGSGAPSGPGGPTMNRPPIDALLEKSAIRDALSRYCHSLDRMDKAMAYDVFAADSSALYYGIYEGTGHGFIDWVWESHRAMESHSHQITNVLIELDGDSAISEAYVTVVLQQRRPSGGAEIQCRGRYLDRWAKQDGRWRIVEREHVIDTQSEIPLPAPQKSAESRRDASDPAFRFLR
ncbi:hypothetical protein B9N43_10630 [Denitratisoma sp. DHT3]|uniref:nuclear transport factor 2 family protein n=1 Tax=Denitratisoma sp. DHT3 TaxID=1981880 RepID=UPI0011987F6B|nr:nuclear transport factor 2 family protein [Denitratisoma sp. DHT3]QDX81669.1 hypothetical protein B9N43_10630 [Denitratisoma sp. DHT3]